MQNRKKHINKNPDITAKRRARKRGIITRQLYLLGGLVLFVLLVAYIILAVLHPVGVIEYIKAAYYSIGSGNGYDIELDEGKPLYTIGDDSRYYVVSSNSVDCFNKNGKTIFKKSHSFSKPVVKHAETRYLLYGQGESILYIGDFAKTLHTKNLSYGIITADISDSGVYAVASKSDGYSSSVIVYNKNHEKIFEWFSSDKVINTIKLSKNGKLLAISTLEVVDGKYQSEFSVLNFKSADPIYSRSYTDDVVYQIYSTDTNVFCTVLSDNIEFINHKKGTVSSYKSDYSVNIVKHTVNKIIAVRSVAANQDESTVEVYKKNGELLHTFKVDNYISDFSFKSNRIFLLGLHDIYKYSIEGELLATSLADYDLLYLEAISSNNVALIKNSSITKFSLSQTEEK